MVCSIHQPNFFPWLGYFEKARRADVFVILDDVKYSKGTVTNRVKVRSQDESVWLTCPVLHSGGDKKIRELATDETKAWRRKHLKTIEFSYRRAPHFNEVYSWLEETYLGGPENLAQFNVEAIRSIAKRLSISTKFVYQSELELTSGSTQLLIDIIKKVGCDSYLSGGGAGGYQEETLFKEHGIKLEFVNFQPSPYGSRTPFLPGLSVIDFLMES